MPVWHGQRTSSLHSGAVTVRISTTTAIMDRHWLLRKLWIPGRKAGGDADGQTRRLQAADQGLDLRDADEIVDDLVDVVSLSVEEIFLRVGDVEV